MRKYWLRGQHFIHNLTPLRALAISVMLIGTALILHSHNGQHHSERSVEYQLAKTTMIIESWKHCEQNMQCLLDLDPLRKEINRIKEMEK